MPPSLSCRTSPEPKTQYRCRSATHLSPLSERDNGRNMFLELLVELEMLMLPVLLLLLLLALSVVLVRVLVSLAGGAAFAP